MIKKLLQILLFIMLGIPLAFAEHEAVFTTYPAHTHQGNKQWIISDVSAGEKYTDEIIVQNLSDKEITLKIAFHESTGDEQNISIIESQDFQNIGKWITLKTNTVTLAPQAKQRVEINFDIPAKTANGKYQGSILVSNTMPSSNSPLNIATRIGNRVYLNVTDAKNIQSSLFTTKENTWQFTLILLALGGVVYALKPQKKSQQ